MTVLQTAISLPVLDPQATFDFYARVFGREACALDAGTASVALPGLAVFFIEREEFNLLLKPTLAEADFATEKYTSMLTCTVATRDDAYGSLKAATEGGGTPCGQAVPYPWGLAAYFKDPDQHLWEVIWRKSAPE